ncbi:hypothetical protein ACCO45_010863 [Purpureocillium lilacinum]|uniref:Uncharacterized protein n=1 Tax=Purpureocillium lilacinum TaxID=33203 RepID=A0ACC4DG41_PURLI
MADVDVDLQAVHDAMVSAAYEAGKMILAANPADIDTGTKLNSVDIVTEVDKGVEKMVSGRLAAAFPSFAFMGEETYKPGVRLGPEPTFVVDPIDGALSLPPSCHPNDDLVVVDDDSGDYDGCFRRRLRHHQLCPLVPQRVHLARPGRRPPPRRGRHLQPVAGPALHRRAQPRRPHDAHPRHPAAAPPLARSPRPLTGLGSALLAVEWGSDREGANFDAKAAIFRQLAASRESGGSMVHSLRSLGSAALNMAAVAAGQLDAYWEGGCWAWDVCAGWCILEEAGGRVVGGNPRDWDTPLESRVYLAVRGAPTGQEELVEEFWAVMGDRKLEYSV